VRGAHLITLGPAAVGPAACGAPAAVTLAPGASPVPAREAAAASPVVTAAAQAPLPSRQFGGILVAQPVGELTATVLFAGNRPKQTEPGSTDSAQPSQPHHRLSGNSDQTRSSYASPGYTAHL
jgi:hypothetical protein